MRSAGTPVWTGTRLVRAPDRARRRDLPYGLLTMIVSLEAILLSTFVMISQNRAAARHQVIADQQWQRVQLEDEQNRQLLDLSNQIIALTKDFHAYAAARSDGTGVPVGGAAPSDEA